MDGRGREGTYNFFSRRLGAAGRAGYRAQGSLKTRDWKRRDWKTRDLKSMESVTIFKSKSYGAEIKTVYGGLVAMVKSSVHR